MSSDTPYFSCPACRGRRLWKPKLAGKRAKCTCGHVLIVPAQPLGQPAAPTNFEEAFEAAAHDQDAVDNSPVSYDVSPAEVPPAAFVPPPIVIERQAADGSISTVGTVARQTVRLDPAIPFRKGLQREEKPAPPAFSPLRDLVLPTLLIVAGVALTLLDGIYKGPDGWVTLPSVIGTVSISMATSLAFAIAAVFAASAMGGVAFDEPVPVIIYKLCAVSLAPGAIGSIATHWIGLPA